MVSSTPSGQMLPLQLIFTGSEKSKRAIPKENSVKDLIDNGFHLTQTPTHWSTMKTMKDFVEKILVPYFLKIIDATGRNSAKDHPKAIWLIDCWAVHKSKEFRSFLKKEYPWILLLFIPPSCTSKAQPQDVSLQKPLKAYFVESFDIWATTEIQKQISSGLKPQECKLNLSLTNLKPLVCKWIYDSFIKCQSDEQNVRLGWVKPGLTQAWDTQTQTEALKEHIMGELFEDKTIYEFPTRNNEEQVDPGMHSELHNNENEQLMETNWINAVEISESVENLKDKLLSDAEMYENIETLDDEYDPDTYEDIEVLDETFTDEAGHTSFSTGYWLQTENGVCFIEENPTNTNVPYKQNPLFSQASNSGHQ